MKVYCVCIEETASDDEGDVFRVEIFSTIENARMYINKITKGGVDDDIDTEIVEYVLDEPESGDTSYFIEDSDYDSQVSYESE